MPNWVYYCFCLMLLTACQPKPVDDSSIVIYQQPGLSLSLSPATAPVETPLSLIIESEYAIDVISAELNGVSMYMGRIPLRFQKLNTPPTGKAEQWQAEFLLGACSDPAMLWQLSVTVQYADGRKLSVNERFNSSW